MDENNTQGGEVTLLAIEDVGYRYRLFNEGGEPCDFSEDEGTQVIQFVKKEVNEEAKLVTVTKGTTTEAVITMLINRLEHFNSRVPSDYTEVAIDRLNDALRALNMRTEERKERGVEGTNAQ